MPAENTLPRTSLSRRRLLGTAVCLGVGGAAARPLPGGVFVAGSDRLRVGLVGCGGRGTGAAVQALAADAAVAVVAIGDLFADRLASASALLERAAGSRFACPREARFTGADAWVRVIDADVDLVILATPPDCRPRHLAAAVAAGRHVFCETPAAIDRSGAETIREAVALARDRSLSLMSGLAWRRDRETAALVRRVHDGAIGRLLAARMTSLVGLPWQAEPDSGRSAAEGRRRNWVAHPDQSGGDLVERQIHAIDKGLWAFGDEDPTAVEPLAAAAAGTTAVRFLFAAGRSLTIHGGRRPGAIDVVAEIVHGERGRCDLRQPLDAAQAEGRHPGAGRHQAAMADLIRTLRGGGRMDDGAILLRATTATLLARAAVAAGDTLPWPRSTGMKGQRLAPV
jgi:predicted dehydrogenase